MEDKAEAWPLERMIAEIGSEAKKNDPCEEYGTLLEVPGTKVSEEEAALFKDLLDGIFRWDPEKRFSLKEIIEHLWFSL